MRCLLLGMMLLGLTACGGGGGSVVLGPPEDPIPTPNPNPNPNPSPNPDPNPSPTYTILGKIDIAAGVVVDDDINDIFAEHCSYSRSDTDPACQNNTYLQRIADSRSIVQGFASAEATGGDARQERFHSVADPEDFYLIELKANETVRLHVVDYVDSDLDLLASPATKVDGVWVYDKDAIYLSENVHIEAEPTSGQIESITVPNEATYLIRVKAYSGISKYVMQVIPAVSGASPSVAVNFVADEMVVKYKPIVNSDSRTVSSAVVDTQPQLVTLPKAVQARSSSSATATATIQDQNPEFFAKLNTLKEIKRLRLSGDVEYAEPNFIRTLQAVPNDPSYVVQWHYNAINLPQAWDVSTGHRANEVIVAVLDTGVFLTHPDLSSKLVAGYDFVTNKNGGDDPGDGTLPGSSSWHGTHVAGTIAAASDNNSGIAGVSWGAKVMPVRVLGQGGGTSFNVANGIRYAAGLENSSGTVATHKADIINLSLGSTSSSIAERDAISAAIAANVLVVAAAGNNARNELFYPAAYPSVIGVSATRFNGTKASYSNSGSHVDVAAPGGQTAEDLNGDRNPDGVYSTHVNDTSGTRVASYAWMQGTSMAAPHVAGVLALMRAVNPELKQSDVLAMLAACEITAQKAQCSRNDNLGYGQIDAYLAVQKANSLSNAEVPAILVSAVSALAMQPLSAAQPSTESVRIYNYGKETATAISVSKTQSWLTLDPTPSSALEPGQSLALTLKASSKDLDNGRYQDAVSIVYDNGDGDAQKTLTIPVYLVVGATGNGSTLTQHYVLLEDADCDPETSEKGCIVGQDEPDSRMGVNGSPYAEFYFTGVKPGNYRIYAGTDIDVDALICQDGETCGVFPAAGQPLKLERTFNGANITVRLNGADTVQAAGLKRSVNPKERSKVVSQ